jgi:glutamine---fructose-6-phosphate transaminase (isomerizing)
MIRATSVAGGMDIDLPGPEDPQPPYGRTRHPYFLHDMIRSQPSAIRATVAAAVDAAESIPVPPSDRPVLFVGMGTSFHAALASSWAAGPAWEYRQPYRAVDSFNLLLEPELVRHAGAAVVFSSSGETALTHRAQDALRAAGVPQVLVTGVERSRSQERANHVLLTRQADEKAWVHTVSYTTAVAATLALLQHWSGSSAVDPVGVDRFVEEVVGREEAWKSLAGTLEDRSRFLLLGSGPEEATVREASLKLREGAGRFVAWTGVEEFLHGVLPSIDTEQTAVIALATSPLEHRRALTALEAASRAGARVAMLGRSRRADAVESEFELPNVRPPLAPLVDIVPFQFLSYHLALLARRNPDVMGYDEPRILAARRTYGI